MTAVCAVCGKGLEVDLPLRRVDECPHCRADLRTCLQCASYERESNRCREPVAEPPRDKERANFCDFFRFGGGVADEAAPSKEELRAAAEALFKKKS
jgi:hypothetical protein